MRGAFFDLAFTPSVQAAQARHGSRSAYARAAEAAPFESAGSLTENEAAFLQSRDSIYLASVSETGWPYVQHRGGPPGFLRVIGPTTIGWAEFRGNRQYVTTGNAAMNDRVSIIAMDYGRRARLKLMGHIAFRDPADDPELAAALTVLGYKAAIEQLVTIEVVAFDWNCPQHITERFTMPEIERAIGKFRDRIVELEGELAAAKASAPGAAPAAGAPPAS